jgi:hypothetical protein
MEKALEVREAGEAFGLVWPVATSWVSGHSRLAGWLESPPARGGLLVTFLGFWS